MIVPQGTVISDISTEDEGGIAHHTLYIHRNPAYEIPLEKRLTSYNTGHTNMIQSLRDMKTLNSADQSMFDAEARTLITFLETRRTAIPKEDTLRSLVQGYYAFEELWDSDVHQSDWLDPRTAMAEWYAGGVGYDRSLKYFQGSLGGARSARPIVATVYMYGESEQRLLAKNVGL